jgi:3'-5' exoribonuclease
MVAELNAAASGVTNSYLKQLMNSFLQDQAFMDLLRRTPAAKALHHNFIGGLLEHLLEMISLSRDVAKHFPSIDADLLTTGAFLHDIGKVRELSVRKSIEYTTEGRLIGHISLGYEMLVEKIATIPGFPAELTMLLKHIMLSHHGEYEFGSPKRPKIQEAVVIHYLDDLSAKINNFQSTLQKENIIEGGWTGFNKMHDRYLYRKANYGEADAQLTDQPEPRVDSKAAGPAGAKAEQRSARNGAASSEKLPLDL